MFFRPHVYIQVTAGRASAFKIGSPDQVTVPSAALVHPRTLMGDFNGVEQCMKQLLQGLGLRRWHARAPVVLVHLLPEMEGGYTNVELRAFREAMLGAGAGEVYLLADHPPLTQAQQADFVGLFGNSVLSES